MSKILLLDQPRTSQPQFPVGIDWSNPITSGLELAWTPNFSFCTGRMSFTTLSPKFGTRLGIAQSFEANFDVATSDKLLKGTLFTETVRTEQGANSNIYNWFDGLLFIGTWLSNSEVVAFQDYNGTSQQGTIWHNTGGPANYGSFPSIGAARRTIVDYSADSSTLSAVEYVNGVSQGALPTAGTGPWDTGNARTLFAGCADLGNYATCKFAFSRNLSAAERQSLTDNPWQIFAPEQIPIFIAESGGTNHALTGSGITSAAPTLGAPSLSQSHALTASGIAAVTPSLGAPTVTAYANDHALTGSGITAGTPALGAPTIAQAHALSGGAIAAGAPVFGTPTLAEQHALMGQAVTAGAPALGAPTVTAYANDHALTGSGITAGTPALGAPTIAQAHALSGGAIAAGAPVFGTPTLAQQHALMGQAVTAGAPALGAPTVTSGAVVDHPLTGAGITAGTPTLGAPALASAAIAPDLWDSLADPIIALLGTQATLDGQIVSAVFDAAYADIYNAAGSRPVATVLASLPASRGSAFAHGGSSYTVAAIEPDGHGLKRLILETA